MNRFFLFYFLILLVVACNTNENKSTTTPSKISEWQIIFNGKDLTGWETMGELSTTIKDGALHIHATHPNNNAWIFTKKEYQNFILEAEFLMPDSTANSGILFRFDPAKKGTPNKVAYEANFDWRINKQNVMGTLENAARANAIPKVNIKDWQKIRIEGNGDFLQVYFNDKLICATHNQRSLKGRIALQVPIYQGDDIVFRNIRVQELSTKEPINPLLETIYRNSKKPLKPLIINQSLAGWHTIGPGKWSIDGKVLHGFSGKTSSYLVTDKAYKNFYMKYAFKIIKEDNSGIFIRKHPDSTNVSLMDAIECNIYDHNGPAHPYSTGSIVTHARAFYKLIEYDKWNEMEIFAKDNHIILTINGKKSSEAYLPNQFTKAGNICLQAGIKVFTDNGPSDIYFRDIMIREME